MNPDLHFVKLFIIALNYEFDKMVIYVYLWQSDTYMYNKFESYIL